jgi:hypothetical protein
MPNNRSPHRLLDRSADRIWTGPNIGLVVGLARYGSRQTTSADAQLRSQQIQLEVRINRYLPQVLRELGQREPSRDGGTIDRGLGCAGYPQRPDPGRTESWDNAFGIPECAR